MIDRNFFEASITLPSDNSTMLLEGLTIVNMYSNIQLKADEKGQVYYQTSLNEVLEKDISNEHIEKLRNGGWKIEGDKLVKYM